MRNNRTDLLGAQATQEFNKSGLTIVQFIELKVRTAEAFDTTECTFHTIDRDDIVSFYAVNDQWYAKY